MLKDVQVEEEVECEGEKVTLKKVLQQVEACQRIIFVGIDKGCEKCNNDLLGMTSKDHINIRSKNVRENHEERFIFLQDKQHESSVQMKSDENSKIVYEEEESMIKELKKKKDITNVWFIWSEENTDFNKTSEHSRKDKNNNVKIKMHGNENDSHSCHDSSEKS